MTVNKKIQFIIINRLGEFKLEPFEMPEEDIKQLIEWFKDSSMSNFSGAIIENSVKYGLIFPEALLKESILKWREIKD